MNKFHQAVAAITGAGSGIGQALAIELAKRGCHLALSDVNAENLQHTADLLKSYSIKVTTQTVDVSQLEQVQDWAAQTQQQHGKINYIFNNAGVTLGASLEGLSYDKFEWVMNINFWGVVYGSKEFLPYLKQSDFGHIVNISSLFGLIAQPSQGAYNASKFAVRGFTEALRQELKIQKSNVSVTSVHPGGIKTNIAKSAAMDDSLSSLGINPQGAKQSFDSKLTMSPKDAALAILDAVEHDQARVLVGNDAKILDIVQRIAPSHYQNVLSKGLKLAQKIKALKKKNKA
ncbi:MULTISPECIES: SDR family NAD(P)-dependent oxidoreductase [unclassified Acinetobacter]|uniref:SDR family NAD(P)-dependent oxidoreductase n=1 Tax=unclassified Acinetobacter TaxID=196816 RepID=UPI0035BAF34B